MMKGNNLWYEYGRCLWFCVSQNCSLLRIWRRFFFLHAFLSFGLEAKISLTSTAHELANQVLNPAVFL